MDRNFEILEFDKIRKMLQEYAMTDAAKELIAAGSMVGSIKQDAEGMAAAIALLAKNATSGAALMDGTDSYNVDDASAKIRIPYAVYTG